jgi:four helix bundle protein
MVLASHQCRVISRLSSVLSRECPSHRVNPSTDHHGAGDEWPADPGTDDRSPTTVEWCTSHWPNRSRSLNERTRSRSTFGASPRLPRTGCTDLKSQMTRASQSIVDNIVEGCGAASRLEFARYLDISIKSTSEVDYQLEFGRDLGVIPHDVWKPLAREVIEIRKMLSALRRSVVAAAARDRQTPTRRIGPSKTEARTDRKRSSDDGPTAAGTDD